MYNLEVFHARYKGEFFAWSNKREGEDRVGRKLDRVLINIPWIHSFPTSEVEFLLPGLSNHSPMVLTVVASYWLGPFPFKFFNFWADESDFLDVGR